MDRPDPPLPSFLIIGAQKSATRWLRSNLGKHPDVYTSPTELSFFNHGPKVSRWGLEWYRQQFVGWDGEPVVGEATPGYMIPRHDPNATAKRIDRELPDVRLIAVLRNPIDRAESALRHHARRGRVPPRMKLTKAAKSRKKSIRHLQLIQAGRYAECLRPYARRFGDRLLILLHDDVVNDPQHVYRRALQHIGAEPSYLPDELAEVVFSNRKPAEVHSSLTFEERCEMWGYFEDDVRHLRHLVGRRLGVWNPEWAAAVEAAAVAVPPTPTVVGDVP